MAQDLRHFIGGKQVPGNSGRFGEVFNPSTGQAWARAPLASKGEVEAAIADAAAAFPTWAAASPLARARVMFKFKALLEEHADEIAGLISAEHGKVLADAKGSLIRGIEVVEFACGIPHLLKGEFSPGVSTGVDMYSMRQPLGVVTGITPFNFPAMVPLWMAAPALAALHALPTFPLTESPRRAAPWAAEPMDQTRIVRPTGLRPSVKTR